MDDDANQGKEKDGGDKDKVKTEPEDLVDQKMAVGEDVVKAKASLSESVDQLHTLVKTVGETTKTR